MINHAIKSDGDGQFDSDQDQDDDDAKDEANDLTGKSGILFPNIPNGVTYAKNAIKAASSPQGKVTTHAPGHHCKISARQSCHARSSQYTQGERSLDYSSRPRFVRKQRCGWLPLQSGPKNDSALFC